MNKKKLMKNRAALIRFAIQVVFFVLMPAAFTSAFSGIKYIFTQVGAGEFFEMNSFVIALLALCGFTIIFGRFFCGFACAFGSLGDWVYAIGQFIQKKTKRKLPKLPDGVRRFAVYVKYVVLALIILLCFAQIYGNISGVSPWDVFSMFTALSFHLNGYAVGIVLLVAIMVGMVFEERFFCKFLCPMGAIFSLLPMLPAFSLARSKETCLRGCSACERKCPAALSLPNQGDEPVSAACFQCQKCTTVCPKSNVHHQWKILHGDEWWWLLLRGAILYGVCFAAGI